MYGVLRIYWSGLGSFPAILRNVLMLLSFFYWAMLILGIILTIIVDFTILIALALTRMVNFLNSSMQ